MWVSLKSTSLNDISPVAMDCAAISSATVPVDTPLVTIGASLEPLIVIERFALSVFGFIESLSLSV